MESDCSYLASILEMMVRQTRNSGVITIMYRMYAHYSFEAWFEASYILEQVGQCIILKTDRSWFTASTGS